MKMSKKVATEAQTLSDNHRRDTSSEALQIYEKDQEINQTLIPIKGIGETATINPNEIKAAPV